MTRHVVSEPAFAGALKRGRESAEREFRASSVRYWPDQDAVAIMTAGHGGFLVPRASIEPLRGLDPDALSRLELWPGGAAFEIADLDIHVSVHGVLTQALPAMIPAEILSSLFAQRDGPVAAAEGGPAQHNGRNGSRFRKPTPEPA